jgi:signal transduction histidine kinase
VAVQPLVHEVGAVLQPLARDRQVGIVVGHLDDAVIYADRLLLTRVVDNLVRNAVQYNRPDGQVLISAEVEEAGDDSGWTSAHTVLRVTDTGQGISEADRERVFERFYRVERSRNRRTGGAGLGLAIASEVVRLFGGTIRIASSSSTGTTIEVRMPGGRVQAMAAPRVAVSLQS